MHSSVISSRAARKRRGYSDRSAGSPELRSGKIDVVRTSDGRRCTAVSLAPRASRRDTDLGRSRHPYSDFRSPSFHSWRGCSGHGSRGEPPLSAPSSSGGGPNGNRSGTTRTPVLNLYE